MTEAAAHQRIDQWLWHARFLKSRSQAARLVERGKLRINRQKVKKPGHPVKPGDVLTFMYSDQLHVVEVIATATRRGPACEAQLLYERVETGSCEQSTHADEKGDA